jgi:hypothetical protein
MINRMNLLGLIFVVLTTIALLPIQTRAQDDVNSYKVGERVEYKESSYPEVWKEGTIIKLYPEYKQVLIRWDKNPNYPHGYEQGYSINDVRRIKAHADDKPVATDEGDTAKVRVNETNKKNDKTDAPAPAHNNGGTGLMTKEEILGYMRTNGYANGQPKKDAQVCRDLIEEMKQRGVKEQLMHGKDDLSPIYENGCATGDTDVTEASTYNQGTPTTLNWLSGTWLLSVIGGTVDTAPGDGYIYRQNESLAKVGFITINGNGTYIWKVNPSDPSWKYVKGTYRMATSKEMGLQGGAGIVLEKAAEGIDWILYKFQSQVPIKAERIDVQDLQYRGGHRRIGWRK